MTTKTHDQTRKWTLDLGKVDANGRGRKVNRVTLDVELKAKGGVQVLSICGAIWNAAGSDHQQGGQCEDTIAKLFPDNARVQRLVEIWKVWHLNDMKAGCVHQRAEGWDKRPLDPSKPLDAYVDHGDGSQGWNMLTWVRPSEKNPNGLLGVGCPTCGYKYGSAWLTEPLPADVEAEVVRLCGELKAERAATAPECDPQNFAQEHAIRAEAVRVPENPNMRGGDRGQRHFFVTLRHADNTRAPMTTYFSQGSAHTKAPTAMDVLGCLASDASTVESCRSFEEWAREYGFDVDSRDAELSYRTVVEQTEKLKKFLGAGLFRALLEDSNG